MREKSIAPPLLPMPLRDPDPVPIEPEPVVPEPDVPEPEVPEPVLPEPAEPEPVLSELDEEPVEPVLEPLLEPVDPLGPAAPVDPEPALSREPIVPGEPGLPVVEPLPVAGGVSVPGREVDEPVAPDELPELPDVVPDDEPEPDDCASTVGRSAVADEPNANALVHRASAEAATIMRGREKVVICVSFERMATH